MYGAEVMLLNLVEEQIQQGLKPIIGSIGFKGCGEKSLEMEACKRNFHVKIFRMHPGPNFIGALKIIQYARFVKCDLLHSHGYKGNILMGFIPKKIRQLPLITTVHGWTSTETVFTRMRIYEWFDSLALPHIDAVVLVNKGMLTQPKLIRRKNIKLYVVNNGIGIHEPDNYPCGMLKLYPDVGLNIVAVGRLSIEKGFSVLLKAMALVIEKKEDVSLVIFGEGGERRKLEEQVRQLGLQGRVKMPGFMENVAATFDCFDLIVIPSLTEGLPITLLEAMRAKLPIIATKVGGIPNVLEGGTGGLLVDANNVEALSNAIIKLARSQSLCRELAREASVIFRQKYSAADMAESYIQIYVDILS